MASHQFCTFYLGGDLFGVNVCEVQEVLRYQEMTQVPLSSPAIKGLINLRGQIVTAIETREHLGMSARAADKLPMNVVIRTQDGTRAVSLLVDEIGDVLEVDDANFEVAPVAVRERVGQLITGVFKLEKGLMLVLDTARTLSKTAAQQTC